MKQHQLEQLLFDDAQYGLPKRRYGLSDRHIERICKGDHWKHGWRPRQLPDEHKTCLVCGVKFARRMDNGRLRQPHIWQRMVCCGNSCNLRRAWERGKFKDRGK